MVFGDRTNVDRDGVVRSDGDCVKCGAKAGLRTPRYVLPDGAGNEWLEFKCERCGYAWNEPCKDPG